MRQDGVRPSDRWLDPKLFKHLMVPDSGVCWWCQERPAITGEHKFKRSDLAKLMGEGSLVWGDFQGNTREVRGKSGIARDRYGVVKFPKSMCRFCNNERSKPLDDAYDIYSDYLSRYWLRVMPGVSFGQIFGENWEQSTINVARYYAKHFGCRMVRTGLPVPQSLRTFLDGETDMLDTHMAIITTDSVHKKYGHGLSISPDAVYADEDFTHFTGYVLAAYTGSIGVRYEWRRDGIIDRSQFFHHSYPVINRFRDEWALVQNRVSRPGWFASILQWANKPLG